MRILVENGRLLDPSRELDVQESLWIEDGIICEKQAFSANQADRVIDAAGGWVVPGLIDLHVHFRDPGLEYKETIETGCLAAAHGGYTTVCPMPNTKPSTDCPEVVKEVLDKASVACGVHVLPVGAVTVGQKGEQPTDVAALKEAGAKRVVPLKVSGPFHSAMLTGAGEKLAEVLENTKLQEFSILYVTNVTADYVTTTEPVKELLKKQVSSSVRWQQSIERLIADGYDEFVEIGPGHTLSGFMRKINRDVKTVSIEKLEDYKAYVGE